MSDAMSSESAVPQSIHVASLNVRTVATPSGEVPPVDIGYGEGLPVDRGLLIEQVPEVFVKEIDATDRKVGRR